MGADPFHSRRTGAHRLNLFAPDVLLLASGHAPCLRAPPIPRYRNLAGLPNVLSQEDRLQYCFGLVSRTLLLGGRPRC